MPGPGSLSSDFSEKSSSTTSADTINVLGWTEKGSLSGTDDTVTRGRSRSPLLSSQRKLEAQKIDARRPNESSPGQSKTRRSQTTAVYTQPKPLPPVERLTKYDEWSTNSYTAYGRHSNEWLFGNVNLTEAAKSLFGKGP